MTTTSRKYRKKKERNLADAEKSNANSLQINAIKEKLEELNLVKI